MLFVLWMTVLNIAFWVGLHFAVGSLVDSLPEPLRLRWFDRRHRLFHVSVREMKLYRRIGLPKWKDRLPQNNRDFDKRHLSPELSRGYLEKFLLVTCQSEVIHYIIAAGGFLSLLFSLLCEHPKKELPLFFWIAMFMAVGNLPFAMIQRYNRFRLLKTLEHLPAENEDKNP